MSKRYKLTATIDYNAVAVVSADSLEDAVRVANETNAWVIDDHAHDFTVETISEIKED